MSLRPVRAEIKALVDVLEGTDLNGEPWETPEQVAEECIKALDKARADRTLYVAVMQIGETNPFYVGLGPYAGKQSASKAAQSHPGASMAYKMVVIPMHNDEHLVQLLKDVG